MPGSTLVLIVAKDLTTRCCVQEFEEWEFEMGITLQDANIQTGAFGYPGAAVICFLGLLAMWDWDGQRQAAPAPGKTE